MGGRLQLREPPARALLQAGGGSLSIVRDRIEALSSNVDPRMVRLVQGSLLDLHRLSLGTFDYIECAGVIHHMADPTAGLIALRRSLKPDGGIGLMVYAPFGRAGVYQAQAMVQALARTTGQNLRSEAITEMAVKLIDQIPETNHLKASGLHDNDLQMPHLVDLILHPQDRAFTVHQLAQLVNN